MDHYERQQRERLRKIKLSIYRTLKHRGIPRSDIPKAAARYKELYTTSQSVRNQHQKLLERLGPEPYPLAVSLPDIYQQHNFICASLSTIVAPQVGEPWSMPVPLQLLVTYAADEALKYEMQELIYSKLLELLHTPVDHTQELPTDPLTQVLERLTVLEQKITKLEGLLNAE